MLAVFGRINPALRKSITFDNDTAFAQPEFRREVQHPSALSATGFSFPRSRLRISKCSGRRRRGREIRTFLGEPERPKVLHFASESTQHTLLRTMRDMATWFCDAYASWQKGGVENANRRLRRWLPRHIDIDRLSDEEIQDIVITANLTPRKCLGFKTPFQGILKELGKDVQIQFR